MYFGGYLVVGFHSHFHLSSFNINTNIHMPWKESARQSQVHVHVCVSVKGEGGIYFLQSSIQSLEIQAKYIIFKLSQITQ